MSPGLVEGTLKTLNTKLLQCLERQGTPSRCSVSRVPVPFQSKLLIMTICSCENEAGTALT